MTGREYPFRFAERCLYEYHENVARLDALVMGGVLKDDRQVQSLHVQRERVPETTQTLVMVKEWAA